MRPPLWSSGNIVAFHLAGPGLFLVEDFSGVFPQLHGRLARWHKWRACDVGEAKEELENELWRRWSNGRVGEWAVKATEGLESALRRRWSDGKVGEWANSPIFPSLHLRHSSSNPSVVLPTSDLILQPFRCFTYFTVHSPTLPSLYLRHSSFSNPSVASPTTQFCFSYVTSSSLTSLGEPPMQ